MEVFILSSNIGGAQLVCETKRGIMESLESYLDEMNFEDEFYVTKSKMTKKEISELGEFDGF